MFEEHMEQVGHLLNMKYFTGKRKLNQRSGHHLWEVQIQKLCALKMSASFLAFYSEEAYKLDD